MGAVPGWVLGAAGGGVVGFFGGAFVGKEINAKLEIKVKVCCVANNPKAETITDSKGQNGELYWTDNWDANE